MTGVKKVTVTVEINDGAVLTLCGEPIGKPGNSAFVLQDIKSVIADITAKYAGITTAMYGTQRIIDEEKPKPAAKLMYVDSTTGAPCPTDPSRGILCTKIYEDQAHRHMDSRAFPRRRRSHLLGEDGTTVLGLDDDDDEAMWRHDG